MSSVATTIIAIGGIITIAGLGFAGYYYPMQLGSLVASFTPSPAHGPNSTPDLPSSSPTVYPLPSSQRVQGLATTKPVPQTTKLPSPTPTPTPPSNDLTIAFIDTPSHVNSGQSFVVKWQVAGPSGTVGQDTQLKVSYETQTSSGGSRASSSTNSSNSFGSFTVPKVFSSTLSFGREPGELHLTAAATVNGQTLTTTKVIELR